MVGRSLGFFQRASVVADMLGTQGKEDAGAVVGKRAGIVGLQMIHFYQFYYLPSSTRDWRSLMKKYTDSPYPQN